MQSQIYVPEQYLIFIYNLFQTVIIAIVIDKSRSYPFNFFNKATGLTIKFQ